jgi:hypothetical protein
LSPTPNAGRCRKGIWTGNRGLLNKQQGNHRVHYRFDTGASRQGQQFAAPTTLVRCGAWLLLTMRDAASRVWPAGLLRSSRSVSCTAVRSRTFSRAGMNARSPALSLAYSSRTRRTKIHCPRLDVVHHHRPRMSDGTSEHDVATATVRHRSLTAAAIAELRKRGRVVSTCTIQAALPATCLSPTTGGHPPPRGPEPRQQSLRPPLILGPSWSLRQRRSPPAAP